MSGFTAERLDSLPHVNKANENTTNQSTYTPSSPTAERLEGSEISLSSPTVEKLIGDLPVNIPNMPLANQDTATKTERLVSISNVNIVSSPTDKVPEGIPPVNKPVDKPITYIPTTERLEGLPCMTNKPGPTTERLLKTPIV